MLFYSRRVMYQSNRSFNIPSPRAYPGHLTLFLAREGGNLITTHRVFVADWLKTKGLHKLFLINDVYMHSFRSIIKATEKLKQQSGNFPGGGVI